MRKRFAAAVVLGVIASPAFAQTSARNDPLATRPGWEVGGQISDYHYEEPAFTNSSTNFPGVTLTGPRLGPVGSFTYARPRFFLKVDARLSLGNLKYEGSGTMDNVPDTIFEARVVAGGDIPAGSMLAFSPYLGLGYRYLYNDSRGTTSTGYAGYRRYSNYLYAPVGLTARFPVGSRWTLAPTVEYDYFLQGKQRSMLSDANSSNPDITNTQKIGYGYRASLMAESGHLAFGPWFQYWNIDDSDCVQIRAGVCGMEPANWTREIGLEFRYRF